MPGESFLKRKWWHATLTINNRDTNVELLKITSINPLSAAVNARYDAVFAYSNSTTIANCDTGVDVPVASFDPDIADGLFVFRPNNTDLATIYTEIYSYQDAINVATRKKVTYTRFAAYDPLDTACDSTTPTRHDTYEYEEATNSDSVVIHRYKALEYYNQTPCCAAEISIPSADIPGFTSSAVRTKIYYLVYDETNNQYRIYSYNFALLSGALGFHGIVSSESIPAGIQLYDITWVAGILYCMTSLGIYRMYLGSNSVSAKLGEKIDINYNNYLSTTEIQYLFTSGLQSIEYNVYEAAWYMIVSTKRFVGSTLSDVSLLIKLDQTNTNQLRVLNANPVSATTVGSFAVPSNFNPNTNNTFYSFAQSNLATINTQGIVTTLDTTNLFAGMNTLSYIQNPDQNLAEQILVASNSVGQLFRVDTTNKVLINLSISLGYAPIGAATNINGDSLRVNPFPFLFGNSPWLFFIDISASMAGDNKISKIKTAMLDLVQNYMKYGEKISIILYNDSILKITKTMRTYSDVYEVTNFIETYMKPRGSISNFCAAASNAASEFTDLRSCVVISDGVFTDCTDTLLMDSQVSLRAANNNLSILYIDMSGISDTLRMLATNYGQYFYWR